RATWHFSSPRSPERIPSTAIRMLIKPPVPGWSVRWWSRPDSAYRRLASESPELGQSRFGANKRSAVSGFWERITLRFRSIRSRNPLKVTPLDHHDLDCDVAMGESPAQWTEGGSYVRSQ